MHPASAAVLNTLYAALMSDSHCQLVLTSSSSPGKTAHGIILALGGQAELQLMAGACLAQLCSCEIRSYTDVRGAPCCCSIRENGTLGVLLETVREVVQVRLY